LSALADCNRKLMIDEGSLYQAEKGEGSKGRSLSRVWAAAHGGYAPKCTYRKWPTFCINHKKK